jgi:hypothetical protein
VAAIGSNEDELAVVNSVAAIVVNDDELAVPGWLLSFRLSLAWDSRLRHFGSVRSHGHHMCAVVSMAWHFTVAR